MHVPKILIESLAWWHMPVILALGRLRQEDLKFQSKMEDTA
jgi:hypothetical protein